MREGEALNQKGFTLVEIIVAMAILAIFAAVSIPLFSGIFRNVMWVGEKSEVTYDAQREMEEGDMPDKVGEFKVYFRDNSDDIGTIEIDNVERIEATNIKDNGSARKLETKLIYFRKRNGEPDPGDTFASYLTEEDVFVYGANLYLGLGGSSKIETDPDFQGTIVINNDDNEDVAFDGNNIIEVERIFIDKLGNKLVFESSAQLGVNGVTELINIKGDVELNNGGAEINGNEIYIEGDVTFNNSALINGNLVYIKGDVDFRNAGAEIIADTLYIEGNVITSVNGGKINSSNPDGSTYLYGNLQLDAANNSTLVGDIIHVVGDVNLSNGTNINADSIYIEGALGMDPQSKIISSENVYVIGNVSLHWEALLQNNDISYINGDISLTGNDSKIQGGITHVDGSITLNSSADITGQLSCTGTIVGDYTATLISSPLPFPDIISFPLFPDIPLHPDLTMPSLKSDSWYYDENNYVSGGSLSDGIKIFSQDDYSTHLPHSYTDVIIVSKGDITITGYSGLTGVLFAPFGRVSFGGDSANPFEGVVIARDGFYITNLGTTARFKNISHYFDNMNEYPFE